VAGILAFATDRAEARTRAARRGWEHRSEKDEAVEGNLSPDEVALWRKMKSRWKGSPHARLEKFREYLHDHPGELRAERAGHGERKAKALVRQREAAPFVKAPCAPPYRSRVKRACKGWSPLSSSSGVEVPCREPYRYRTKDLCNPSAKWKVAKPPVEEPRGAFDDLLGIP
jgi:hypothetical protein